jgi:hypothetical protein
MPETVKMANLYRQKVTHENLYCGCIQQKFVSSARQVAVCLPTSQTIKAYFHCGRQRASMLCDVPKYQAQADLQRFRQDLATPCAAQCGSVQTR